MSGKPPTPPTKLENETITVWSYKAKYKTAAVRNSDDEKSIEQSFICVKPDGEIVKSSKYSNTDQSFTGVIEDIWKGEQVVKETKIEDGDVTKEAVLKALHEKQDGTESDESYEKSFSSHHTDSSGELVDIPASDDRCEDKSDERSTSSKQSSSSFKNFECEDEIVVVPERIESEKELIHHSEIKNETQPPMTKSSDSLKEKLLDEGIVSVTDSERKLQKVNSKSRQLVQVIAPLSLGEGYAFEVQSKDKVFIVEVPEGGIEEGDSFYVPLPDDTFGQKLPSKAPIGQWKDGLFDCLKHGGLHASFLSALCCTQVLMAQIMTRMQLNWFGHQTSISETANTFRYVIILIIAYYTLYYIYVLLYPGWDFYDEDGIKFHVDNPVGLWVRGALRLLFVVWSLYALAQSRAVIRKKYDIETKYFGKFEDYVYALFCSCCVTSQMARHTADYESYDAICCSGDGLSDDARIDPICEMNEKMDTGIMIDESHLV